MTYLVGKSRQESVGVTVSRLTTALEWTKDAPTEEGWYWREYNGSIHIVKVINWFDKLVIDVGEYNQEFTDESWLGPLPVPELPE